MKNQKYYFLCICVLFLTSCSKKVTENSSCANEHNLFSIPDSIKKITIDYQLATKPLLKSIEAKLEKDVCGAFVSFGLILKNSDILKVQYLKKCDDGIISCFLERKQADIILNQTGDVLIEYEHIPIDSIKFWMRDNFIDKTKQHYTKTSVQWHPKTPKDSIEKVFSNVKEGYFLTYENLSQAMFSKKICELTSTQVETLKSQLPFIIQLDFHRLYLIPPPPPPAISEETK